MESEIQELADKAIKHVMNSGAQYVDVRAEKYEQKSILIENKEIEYVKTKKDVGIGIRIAKDGVWNFCSITEPQSFKQIKESIDKTIKNSKYYAKNKRNKVNLYSNSSKKFTKNYPVLKIPELEELIDIGLECNKIILDVPKIIKSIVSSSFSINSKFFTNSEGSEILQNYTDTTMDMISVAHESGITQSINTTEGGRGGLEQLIQNNKVQEKAKEIALKTSQLIYAKPVKRRKHYSCNESRFCFIINT